ncbi:hypothetical protein PROFUN_15408 [Planoprotostelium fungivorum]|uniref:Uncharacterized protein n=1 Tax=Planoprotostelium fungivorum TaxID=1890364 RepID=A0A2P6MVY4_9EUKA|nr:hypothetical protein PROFUN_15408 [Planoprotostelium fungivorum]
MALYPQGRGNSVKNAYFSCSNDGYIANIPAQTLWVALLMDDKGNSLPSLTSLNHALTSCWRSQMFDHYCQVNLPRASLLSALTPWNYFFNNKNLYMWMTNDQANSGVLSQMGFYYKESEGPNNFTPATLTSNAYRADINPAGKEGGNRTVFIQVSQELPWLPTSANFNGRIVSHLMMGSNNARLLENINPISGAIHNERFLIRPKISTMDHFSQPSNRRVATEEHVFCSTSLTPAEMNV